MELVTAINMKRTLKISYYQTKPSIRIIAAYLIKFGFRVGDKIELTISKNKIEINKLNNGENNHVS